MSTPKSTTELSDGLGRSDADLENASDSRTVSNHNRPYLHSPIIDFLGLGGLGIILSVLCLLLVPRTIDMVMIGVWAAIVAHFINNPHFAASYQVFYSDFVNKISGLGYSRELQFRYIFAGIVVPIIIWGLYSHSFIHKDPKFLAWSVNAMSFFVGWHYVKQGYGCLIVDSVLKKAFFSDAIKKILLLNCYICWIYSWTKANLWAYESQYWGIKYVAFAVPKNLSTGLGYATITTSIAALVVLILHFRQVKTNFPLNGLVGYISAIYLWLVAISSHPVIVIFIPALHSLQYMTMVSRYKISEYNEIKHSKPKSKLRNMMFNGVGFWINAGLLGYLGFWGLPNFLAANTSLNDGFVVSSSAVALAAWIFINIHHYFLDNVMWRRENKTVGKYLFNAFRA